MVINNKMISDEFNWDNIAIGAAKYDSLMKMFNNVDVSKNEAFQKRFTGFYRVRRSKERFLQKYYSLMQSLKNKETSYKEIINCLYTFEGKIEASFSSKLLATLNPEMPIWDQYVLANAGIESPKPYNVTIEMCINKYETLKMFYKNFLKSEKALNMISEFNERLPEYQHFTNIKKIDLMFWQRR